MICPYCVEEVPANSQKHEDCRVGKDKEFPLAYFDFHGGSEDPDPVVLSIVGFRGHGKTVFLCALFEYLDNQLTGIWPDFYNRVLDQESLDTLNANREKLEDGRLPEHTKQIFPRPGIFRLTNMPHSNGHPDRLPPLVDTTVLIYDPPGEAFLTEDKIVEYARFVKRSNCVLFLIDLTSLGDSIASKMAKLLDTYLLGMRRMGIEQKSQHMIVVYTKSDDMKISVPEFQSYLEAEPQLAEYLTEQRPATLKDPSEHLRRLEHISHLLERFTREDLNAGKFMHVAKDWFASVNYTVVSSLGSAPEKRVGEEDEELKLSIRMSPRCVADPLLYVLAKSIKVKEHDPPPDLSAPPPQSLLPQWALWALIAVAVGAVLIAVTFVIGRMVISFGAEPEPIPTVTPTSSVNTNRSPATPRPSPKTAGAESPAGMVYVPGGEFVMGNPSGDEFERPAHRVKVAPFFLDIYEVTCEEYTRFIKATGHSPPLGGVGASCPPGADQRPMTGVNWYDAVAYARWAGKRLPTEEEWEFAARGPQGHLYPWGAEWRTGAANAREGTIGALADVGQFKGASPYGSYDMIGNAWEWTASDLRAYPGGKLPIAQVKGLKVIRGGSWKARASEATTTYRGYLQARGSKDYSNTGFRCARDVNAPGDVSNAR